MPNKQTSIGLILLSDKNLRGNSVKIMDVIQKLHDLGCKNILIKKLSPNDNSKNQIYLGGEEFLRYFPITESELVPQASRKKSKHIFIFRNHIEFFWITPTEPAFAPDTKVIFYPQYPETRLSGFLRKCSNAPNELLNSRLSNRYIVLSHNDDGQTFGFVDYIDKDFSDFIKKNFQDYREAIFFEANTQALLNEAAASIATAEEIIARFKQIYSTGWIKSGKLNPHGVKEYYDSPNAGGLTLEAELGVKPNSQSKPDYRGWEIKQHSTTPITLFTPEPDAGYYNEHGAAQFIKKYGYEALNGQVDRFNFGGIHKVNDANYHHLTDMKLIIHGYSDGAFTKKDGYIGLQLNSGQVVAKWTFTKLLAHWQRKHQRTCFVSSEKKDVNGVVWYKYLPHIQLGTNSTFLNFLKQLETGIAYYDPGCKCEKINGVWTHKARNQFRIKAKDLHLLYETFTKHDVSK